MDQIEVVLNECFQYMLKKNKKAISKRSFRQVIAKSFKFLFPMIIHSYHQLVLEAQKGAKTPESAKAFPDSLDMRCEAATYPEVPRPLTSAQIDGLFQMFSMLQEQHFKLMKKKVFRRLKRRAFNNTLSNAHSMPVVGDDKENIRPDTQGSEGPTNIVKTCEKSRVIRHPLGHKQLTATTFSFNNQATCSDDYAFLQTANKQATHNSTVTLKMIR